MTKQKTLTTSSIVWYDLRSRDNERRRLSLVAIATRASALDDVKNLVRATKVTSFVLAPGRAS